MGFIRIWNFLKLTRPLFLAGGFMLYFLGTLVSIAEGAHFNLERFISGQILVTAIQLVTQYSNEYYDLEGDRLNTARTWFSGGSGVLVSGALSPKTARSAAIILVCVSLLALVFAGLLVPVVFLIGLLSLLAAWSYSGPPLALARTGWGEITASLVVAFLVPIVGYTMQTGGKISPTLLVTCLPLVLIHFAMLIAFQIPDCPSDRASGKRTLCVRFGEQQAARLHNFSLFLAFCAILGLSLARWPGAQFAWLALPLAAWQSWTIHNYIGQNIPRFHGLTMRAIGLFAATAGLWVAGYALLIFIV